MNVAVVGSSGYIAGHIIKRFEQEDFVDIIFRIGRNLDDNFYLDLEDAEKFDYDCLNNVDYVIFTAGISSPDRCASEYDYCWKINVEGTKYFITEALERQCKVLFFSSDAVFGDIPGAIYTEKSETNPKTVYGNMKKAVEDEFFSNKLFKSLRLSYVSSINDKFISYCLSCINNNQVAEVFHPFYRNVIFTEDVITSVVWMIKNWEIYIPFALNVAGYELVSRVRMADELNRVIQNRLKYIIVTPSDEFYNNRPPITQMTSLYLQKNKILDDISFSEKMKKELVNHLIH